MKCPRCQHENPPQANFCLECGARVALTCTKCRSELPARAKFCLECGEPVASQATLMRTILGCEVEGLRVRTMATDPVPRNRHRW